MKIVFDTGYIEMRKSPEPGKVFVIIASKDPEHTTRHITNSAEITVAQLEQLTADVK